jgi:hypothetical protein
METTHEKATMATMLELPRELYLMICDYLKPTGTYRPIPNLDFHTDTTFIHIDLTHLARVSRDHYLAVQQPIFQHVSVYSFDSLVKLLSTALKVPVVSHISPKQRRYWHKLSDAELRERDIRSLHIRLAFILRREATDGQILRLQDEINWTPGLHVCRLLAGSGTDRQHVRFLPCLPPLLPGTRTHFSETHKRFKTLFQPLVYIHIHTVESKETSFELNQ